ACRWHRLGAWPFSVVLAITGPILAGPVTMANATICDIVYRDLRNTHHNAQDATTVAHTCPYVRAAPAGGARRTST
ncbi:MAG TPA: hypothetical protein VL002_10640, partial [Candidimonas sp.]|nr:hypothetical protein [Candidimonas sp.]